MAAYNGEKYLREQVDSILCQTYQDFELIICDDCSTDSTPLILKEFARTDPRIKCYFNESNLGFKKNFEKAINFCAGDYIALSDQDDIWTNDHLELLLDNINDFDFVFSKSSFIDESGKKTGNTYPFYRETYMKKVKNLKRLDLFYLILVRNHVQGCTVLFKKELLLFFLPIPDALKYHDWWFALVSSFFFKMQYLNQITVYYRTHDNNASDDEKDLARQQKRSNYYHSRYNLIRSFYECFKTKMNNNEEQLCQTIMKYYYSVIYNENLFFRLAGYMRFYFLLNLDEALKKYILFFPRLVYQILPKNIT